MSRRTIMPVFLLGTLAGCATPTAHRALIAAAPATIQTNSLRAGRVVDVREVDLSPDAGSRAGVDAVLAALAQPLSPASATLQEVVIQQPDGNPVSIGGAYPGVAVGNRVSILAGAATTLVPGE